MSVPGRSIKETGVIEESVPLLTSMTFLGMRPLLIISYLSIENDANCVGLSELAHPEIENAACVVIGTGIGGAMLSMANFAVVATAGGEDLAT